MHNSWPYINQNQYVTICTKREIRRTDQNYFEAGKNIIISSLK